MLLDSNLTELRLNDNTIGNLGVEYFHKALFFSKCKLKILDLSDCAIEYAGLMMLSEAMKINY